MRKKTPAKLPAKKAAASVPAKAKDPRKVQAGTKGGKMSGARNREVVQAHRKKHILLRRLEGVSEADIAAELGLSQSQVSRLYQEAMRERVPEDAALALSMRERQLAKLAVLGDRIMGLANNRDLRIQAATAEGNVIEMTDFEAMHKLTDSLVKVCVHEARLAGACKAIQVEEINKGFGLNIAKLALLTADEVANEKGT